MALLLRSAPPSGGLEQHVDHRISERFTLPQRGQLFAVQHGKWREDILEAALGLHPDRGHSLGTGHCYRKEEYSAPLSASAMGQKECPQKAGARNRPQQRHPAKTAPPGAARQQQHIKIVRLHTQLVPADSNLPHHLASSKLCKSVISMSSPPPLQSHQESDN